MEKLQSGADDTAGGGVNIILVCVGDNPPLSGQLGSGGGGGLQASAVVKTGVSRRTLPSTDRQEPEADRRCLASSKRKVTVQL